MDPIDYEKFIKENLSMLESSPLKELLLFPEDDISVTTLQRKFRTVEIPVPGPAKFVDLFCLLFCITVLVFGCLLFLFVCCFVVLFSFGCLLLSSTLR